MTGMEKIPVIGISGGSCSGKSSIATRLVAMMKERGGAGGMKDRHAVILSLDSYYVDLAGLPMEERRKRNFDAPEAIDIELAAGHLLTLASGGNVLVPVYRFEDHTRAPLSEWTPAGAGNAKGRKAVVIVEGLFTLYFSSFRSLLDLSIFVDAGHETCLARRLRRDVAERGRTRDDVVEQYEKTVRPMYERHVAPTRAYANMAVDGERDARFAAEAIMTRLAEMGLC